MSHPAPYDDTFKRGEAEDRSWWVAPAAVFFAIISMFVLYKVIVARALFQDEAIALQASISSYGSIPSSLLEMPRVISVQSQDYFHYPFDPKPFGPDAPMRDPGECPIIVQTAAIELARSLNEHARGWDSGPIHTFPPTGENPFQRIPASARPFARFWVDKLHSYHIGPVEHEGFSATSFRGMRSGPHGGPLVAYNIKMSATLRITAAAGFAGTTVSVLATVQCAWDAKCNLQGLLWRTPVPLPLAYNRRSVRVLNANLWNYNRWPSRLERVEAELARWVPDVVLMQELRVTYNNQSPQHAPQPAQMAEIMSRVTRGPVNLVYTKACMFGNAHFMQEEGVGIISRFPVIDHGYLILSHDQSNPDDGIPRRVVWATIATPDGEVTVSTVHLTLTAHARARHYEEMGAWVQQMRARSNGRSPVVLSGDMNEELHNLSPHPFLSRGFRDAFTEYIDDKARIYGGPDALPKHIPRESPLTFPAWEPIKRIDHIFIHGNATASYASIAGLTPDTKHKNIHEQFPSDHAFVVADIVVKGGGGRETGSDVVAPGPGSG